MSNDIITTDLQSPYVDSPFVTLFELELAEGTTLYFHSGLDDNLEELMFHPAGQPYNNTPSLANTYVALPIMLDGVDVQADGASNRPSLTVANISNLFKAALNDNNFTFDDIIGKRLVRRRTFQKYLVGGSDAIAPFELPITSYYVDRISAKNNLAVTFELAAPFDVSGVKLPSRIVTGKYCPWIYQGDSLGKGSGCLWRLDNTITYEGASLQFYFNSEDEPIVSSSVSISAPSFSSGTTYGLDNFVTYEGFLWQSESSSNLGNTPSASSIWWRKVHRWSTYSSSTNYSVGSLVRYDGKIWRCLVSGSNNTPRTDSVYWTRVDYCGKTLESCKCRFQVEPHASNNQIPSARKNTKNLLPFGGFPGSVKFS